MEVGRDGEEVEDREDGDSEVDCAGWLLISFLLCGRELSNGRFRRRSDREKK